MPKRVLVTGSEGFTGRYVCKEFADSGWEVWRAGLQLKSGKSRYLSIDLRSPKTLKLIADAAKPNVVVHLAAKAFVAGNDPADFYETNLLGTRQLLEALSKAAHPPSCTILASSANVYGNSDHKILNELSTTAPANDYAVSKLAMEYLAQTYMGKLNIVITRPFNYSGVGQDLRYLIPKIVMHFKSRAPLIELGNVDVARDFSDVRDVARIYRLLAEAQPTGETVNLCSGQATTLKACIAIASRITGHKIEVKVNPAFVRANEIKSLVGCRNKLDSIVSIGRQHAIQDTLQWMLKT